MKLMNKKGLFDILTGGMIAFITFVLVVITGVLLIRVAQETPIVCGGDAMNDGNCVMCREFHTYMNSTACCNQNDTTQCLGNNRSTPVPYDGGAYNATLDLQDAALLPSQFSQILVITVIIVGIIAMLGIAGVTMYQKFK